MISDYLFSDALPIALQAPIIILCIATNLFCFVLISTRYSRGLCPSAFFVLLNSVLLCPYIFSISGGQAGFAAVMGVAKYGFDSILFSLFLFQAIVVPLWLLFLSRLNFALVPSFYVLRDNDVSRVLLLCFTTFVLSYFVLYMLSGAPLYKAIFASVAEASQGRVEAQLSSQFAGDESLFRFKNAIQPFGLAFCLALAYQYKNLRFFWYVGYILIAAINFSKGSIALSFIVLYFFNDLVTGKRLNYSALVKLALGLLGFLTLYRYWTHPTGISLDNSVASILLRLYNNSSSLYLQHNLFSGMFPIGHEVANWGFLSRVFEHAVFIPKQEVYQYIYAGAGQAGSLMVPQLFFAFSWFALPLALVLVMILPILDRLLLTGFDQGEVKSPLYLSIIFVLGMKISISLFNFSTSVFSVFTIIRLEYLLPLLCFSILYLRRRA